MRGDASQAAPPGRDVVAGANGSTGAAQADNDERGAYFYKLDSAPVLNVALILRPLCGWVNFARSRNCRAIGFQFESRTGFELIG